MKMKMLFVTRTPKHREVIINGGNIDKLKYELENCNIPQETIYDCLEWSKTAEGGDTYNEENFDIYVEEYKEDGGKYV